MPGFLTLGEAAKALSVSQDTLRRWDRSVEVDGVMALVEIEAGPFLLTAAVTRDSVEELGLAEGVEATATVKATSVMIERSAS